MAITNEAHATYVPAPSTIVTGTVTSIGRRATTPSTAFMKTDEATSPVAVTSPLAGATYSMFALLTTV